MIKPLIYLFLLSLSYSSIAKNNPPPHDHNQEQQQEQDQNQDQDQYQTNINDLSNRVNMFNESQRQPANITCNAEPGFVTAGRISYSVTTLSGCGGSNNYTHSGFFGAAVTIPFVPKRFKTAAIKEINRLDRNDKQVEGLQLRLDTVQKDLFSEITRLRKELEEKNRELSDKSGS